MVNGATHFFRTMLELSETPETTENKCSRPTPDTLQSQRNAERDLPGWRVSGKMSACYRFLPFSD